MKALALLRSLASRALIASCLILAGCSSPTATHSQRDSDTAQDIPDSWKPHLLYLLPAPHSRLYVEVDAVEGCAPDEIELQKLRDFLSTYCNKPGGIEIVRSEVIPIKAATGLSPRALARKYMKGPDTNTASPPAFMYVLFYSDALCQNTATGNVGLPGTSKTAPRRPKMKIPNPYSDVLPYPATYFNVRYFRGTGRNEMLQHEAGHLLGLVRRPAYASGLHCLDKTCLMNATLVVHIGRLLTFRDPIVQHRLCDRCVADLAEYSKQAPLSNLRYVGPVLVRSESGYQVLSLPDRVMLEVGDDPTEQRCRDFAARVRTETPDASESMGLDCWASNEVLEDPVKVSQLINSFKNDPFDSVREAGPKVLLRACVGRYDGLQQYSNVVATLHQAIFLDSKDDWSYNNLAWTEATCPDASVRNGGDAVSAATKACELTEWKNGGWIDTLAAAYAEAGDFKRAIEFQERALQTGKPADSEQNEMQERMSLYEQSKPFRDK
jgi:hypothetical protein